MHPGTRNLITDVPGIRVGNAQDDRLKSGSTVLLADKPFVASVEVMGGAPGTRETDLLAPHNMVENVDALVLSGGSAFGLDACSGVVDGLRADGRGFQIGPAQIPLVPGAILFDLLNGGQKDWQDNPYRALGRAAYENADVAFPLGTVGAGTGALTAMHKGGLGSASLVLENGTTVGALVAANPIGSVTVPNSRNFWAAPFEIDGEFGGLGPNPSSGFVKTQPSRKVAAMIDLGRDQQQINTTIAIVATDAPLTKAEAKRIAVAAHDGMARAIVPAHTPSDGDLVFALSTNTRTGDTPVADVASLGNAAAHCLTRAIARAVFHATPAENDLLPCWTLDV